MDGTRAAARTLGSVLDEANVDGKNLEAVGRLVLEVSALELAVTAVLSGFISYDFDTVWVTLADEGFRWKLGKLKTFLQERLPTGGGRDQAVSWVNRAGALYDERNRIIHSFWSLNEGRLQALKPTARSGILRLSQMDVDAGDLGKVSDKATALIRELMREIVPTIDESTSSAQWAGFVVAGKHPSQT